MKISTIVEVVLLTLLTVIGIACVPLGIYAFVLGCWQITGIFVLTALSIVVLLYEFLRPRHTSIINPYSKGFKEKRRCTEK